MRIANIGPYQIMKINRKFDYLYDLIKYVDGLGDGWRVERDIKLFLYIHIELRDLNIHNYIYSNFRAPSLYNSIRLTKKNGAIYICNDPLEIKKFFTGFDATFTSLSGEDNIVISEYDGDIHDFTPDMETCFIIRDTK